MLYKRNIVSIDLSILKYKNVIYQYFGKLRIAGKLCEYTENIILLEEFDTVFAYLKKKNEVADRMKSMWISKDITVSDKDDDTVDNIGNPEEFNLRDLLEIIQGPVPMLGRMIIATTNNFEEIQPECPALFRAGRLMPIEFGYLDQKHVNMLIDHHFATIAKKDRPYIDFDPQTSTAEILDYIMLGPEMFKSRMEQYRSK